MKLTVFAHVIEIAIIAFLLLYIFVLTPSQSQSSQSSFNIPNANFNSPPTSQKEINSAKDVIDDLSFLGCKLVNVNATESKIQSGLVAVNYSDFRWVAYNTKLVFYAEISSVGISCFTLYEGLPIASYFVESGSQTSGTESGAFTKYEKVEFTSAYADYDATGKTFTIYMVLKNTGSATATVDATNIFYNGKPAEATAYATFNPVANFTSFTMIPGNVTSGLTITMLGGANSPWQSGMTVEVMIQTSAGKQYPKVITLP